MWDGKCVLCETEKKSLVCVCELWITMTSPPRVPQSSLWMLLHVHTHTLTHTQSFLSLVSMSRELCPGQTLLFISMTPLQRQMYSYISSWPPAKKTTSPWCLCLSWPIAKRENDKTEHCYTPHSHTVLPWIQAGEDSGMSVSIAVMEIMMSP